MIDAIAPVPTEATSTSMSTAEIRRHIAKMVANDEPQASRGLTVR